MSMVHQIMSSGVVLPSTTIAYIGGAGSASGSGDTVSPAVTSSAQKDDLMVVHHCLASTSNLLSTMKIDGFGWTKLHESYIDDTYDIQHQIFYKRWDGETSVTLRKSGGGVQTGQVMVFRNVNTIELSTSVRDPSSDDVVWDTAIGNLRAGNAVVLAGAVAHASGLTSFSAGWDTNLDQSLVSYNNAAQDVTAGMGFKAISSDGTFDPDNWSTSTGSSSSSDVGVGLTLR
jgi:hypothetical protein